MVWLHQKTRLTFGCVEAGEGAAIPARVTSGSLTWLWNFSSYFVTFTPSSDFHPNLPSSCMFCLSLGPVQITQGVRSSCTCQLCNFNDLCSCVIDTKGERDRWMSDCAPRGRQTLQEKKIHSRASLWGNWVCETILDMYEVKRWGNRSFACCDPKKVEV